MIKYLQPFLFILLILGFTSTYAQIDPQDMVTYLGQGINLGNTLEVDGQDGRYEKIDEYYFKDYKTVGFSHVRIPVKWDYHTLKSAPYTIDTDWLKRVDTVINMALDNGLFVVLNTHHEDWLTENFYAPDTLDRFVAMWSQISDYFQDKPDSVVFEVINEPYFDLDSLEVDSINHLCLAEIRENNPTRNVMICSGDRGSAEIGSVYMITKLNVPDDDYIIAWWHYYKPWTTGQQTWGSQEDYDLMTGHFATIKNWSDSTGVPVYTGEYGVEHTRPEEDRFLWLEHAVYLNEENGFAHAYWDANPGETDSTLFVYYRAEGFWYKDQLEVLTGYEVTEPQVVAVSDGLWSDPSIWNTGSVPVAGDHVLIQHSVGIDTDIQVAGIAVSDIISGTKLIWQSTTQGYTIEVTNDFIAEGKVDLNDGNDGFDIELKFTGPDTSYLRTVQPWSASANEFGPITIDKSGSGHVIITEGQIGTKDTLTLNSGLLKVMPGADFISLNGGSNMFANASDASHVVGRYGRTLNSNNFVYFPVGDGIKYRPIGVKGIDFYDGSVEWIEAEVIPESATAISTVFNDPLQDVSDLRHWKLTSRNADMGTIKGFALSYSDDDGFADGAVTASIGYLTAEVDGSLEANKWYQNPHLIDTADFTVQPDTIIGNDLEPGYLLNLSSGESVYAALAEIPPPPGLPEPGDLIIMEVNSHETPDASWVEIQNVSGTEIYLEGTTFEALRSGWC